MKKYNPDLSQETFEKIERYLFQSMHGEELKSFEKEMEQSKPLQEEVKLQSQLIAMLELQAFSEEKKGQKHRIGIDFSRIIGIAAVGVLGIAVVIWIFSRQTNSADSLFEAYFYPDPGLPVTMDAGDTPEFEEGMVSYKEENYARAIQLWQSLEVGQVSSDTITYYLAMAQLNQGNLEGAATLLEQILSDPESEFHQKAAWYLALIWIKNKELEQARKLLQDYREDSRIDELCQKLDSLIKTGQP
ncbi:tetratricopeptide repeat protein [Algoriphagus litoralis]|uniref:tetratricopeptide repeat protein n=1 Tax=Algoriphagus litoralis TaxID=2202829 RepID=UPI000DB99B9C|nr:tetratricopeptide repeat protein [Algoriphagus litoralis]